MESNTKSATIPAKKIKLASNPRCTNNTTKKPEQNNSLTKKKPPNWFLAIPFDNPEIRNNVKMVQDLVVQKEPKLKNACVPVEKSHLTLFVFHTDNIDKVIEVLNPVLQNYKLSQPNIKASGIGNFKRNVAFTKLDFDEHLKELWIKIGQCLVENQIIEPNDAKIEHFTPHLTLMKLSRMKSKTVKKIDMDLFESFEQLEFGDQPVEKIQVLSMNLPVQEDGYYFCQHTYPIQNSFSDIENNRFKNTSLLIVSGATALLAFAYIVKRLIKK